MNTNKCKIDMSCKWIGLACYTVLVTMWCTAIKWERLYFLLSQTVGSAVAHKIHIKEQKKWDRVEDSRNRNDYYLQTKRNLNSTLLIKGLNNTYSIIIVYASLENHCFKQSSMNNRIIYSFTYLNIPLQLPSRKQISR